MGTDFKAAAKTASLCHGLMTPSLSGASPASSYTRLARYRHTSNSQTKAYQAGKAGPCPERLALRSSMTWSVTVPHKCRWDALLPISAKHPGKQSAPQTTPGLTELRPPRPRAQRS